jgi:hypothetical protein
MCPLTRKQCRSGGKNKSIGGDDFARAVLCELFFGATVSAVTVAAKAMLHVNAAPTVKMRTNVLGK